MDNDQLRAQFGALDGINRFGKLHAADFAAGSTGTEKFAALNAVVTDLRQRGADKVSGKEKLHGGTTLKRLAYGELKADLTAIRDVAQSISDDEDEDHPELEGLFRLPRSGGDEALLAAARAFRVAAQPLEALFIRYELPADFLADLDADIAAFESAEETQEAGLVQQVGGTAALADGIKRGMKLRGVLDTIVKNKYRGNAAVLAEWETVRRGGGSDKPVGGLPAPGA